MNVVERETAQSFMSAEDSRVSQKQITVCVVAGETSGDGHAAKLLKELKLIYPHCKIFGMGGSRLREIGVETVVDSESHASLMGFTELLGSISNIFSSFNKIIDECKKRNPDLVILVDYPDFNLRLAKKLKKKDRKILYFITPQMWAWRSGRVKQLKKYCDAVAPIFPFEEIFFQQRGVRAEYVGHPFLDDAFPIKNKEEFFKSIGGEPNCPAIALLPGSRISEIDRLVKPMIEAWQLLRRSRPGLQAVIPLAPGLSLSKFKELLPADRTDLFLVDGRAREVLVNCDFSVVASGTATVEAALSQTPFVVVYRLSRISYLISRLLVRGVSFFAMPNLIAGKRVVTELLQSEVTGERIAEEIENLFGDPGSRERQKQGLQKIKEKLATKNSAGKQAALLASKLIEEIDEKKLSRRWSRS
jgi:lipid-A-disaccharide synthase